MKPTMDESLEDQTAVLDDLLARAQHLLSELEALSTHIQALKQPTRLLRFSHFTRVVRNEATSLARARELSGTNKRRTTIVSSNLPYLEALWASVKTTKDVLAVQHQFYPGSEKKSKSQPRDLGQFLSWESLVSSKGTLTVDAIADGGATWMKVHMITNRRLFFDLAKEGWASDEEDEMSEDDENARQDRPQAQMTNGNEYDALSEVPLVKLARTLTSAASCFRVRAKTPKVTLILPRLHPDGTRELDRVLAACRATGATVICGKDCPSPPPLAKALVRMVPTPLDAVTSTVNLDCTILLALASDISHGKATKQPWMARHVAQQFEEEDEVKMLSETLYPVLRGRELVCTKEAAKRACEIVGTVATASEVCACNPSITSFPFNLEHAANILSPIHRKREQLSSSPLPTKKPPTAPKPDRSALPPCNPSPSTPSQPTFTSQSKSSTKTTATAKPISRSQQCLPTRNPTLRTQLAAFPPYPSSILPFLPLDGERGTRP
jgi:hypothetical protein